LVGEIIIYKPNRKTINEVKNVLSKITSNIIIISNEYINNITKLDCKCLNCGHNFKKSWTNLQTKPFCPQCSKEKRMLSDDEIKTNIYKINESIVIHDIYRKEIKGRKRIIIKCECLICNKIWKPRYENLIIGKGCPNCYKYTKNFGENHYKYNPNLTDEERLLRRNYYGDETIDKWRKEVFQRDNYTCVITNKRGQKLNAHHLNGFNWYECGRFDVNNGVTLSENIHKLFHAIYGRSNNTKEQFEEFRELLNI
jgi:Zn finger protein HypA/HybF involved in hydrogenase expression